MAVDPNHPNMRLWNELEKTDPKFVKPITGKQYKGSSPSPHWIRMRLTERFGPAGLGWGTTVLREQVVQVGVKAVHYCTIRLWYVLDGQRGEVEACGGTEIGGVRKSSGEAWIDEDGSKKSLTDALVKAAAEIGMCADIFLGRWDDSKYVEQRGEEERAAGAAISARTQAEKVAELAARATTIIAYLEACETQEAFLAQRAAALGLRPELLAAKMADVEAMLGGAVKAAAARLAQKEQAA